MATHFEREIREQPCVIEGLLRDGRAAAEAAAQAIRRFGPEWVMIAGRGSSDNAARYAQYLLGAHNRLGVALAVPSLFTLYDSPPRLLRTLTIGISQSGQSPDIVSVLREARTQGGITLALSNDPESPLSQSAELRLPLLAGPELAVAATKTYTAQLFALAMLSAALEGNPQRWAELSRVPAWLDAVIDRNTDLLSAAAEFRDARQLVVLGRGFNYSTAFEVALKLKETSYFLAEPYSVADLLHGPIAMIDRGFPVILIAARGRSLVDVPDFLTLLEQRGARVLAISNAPEVLSRVALHLELPGDVPEWLSPIVGVVPGQLFAGALAESSGQNPDRPRGLAKVTLTR
ncbi:MAG TPA: SIS domain-containing protein [Polyangiaceae bacterium]|nr:SIS domain-containing protein [Polyangiaceae bacterium]